MERIYSLDYLRGFAALGILVYHYLSWTIGKFNSETFMGRFGVYGVSIFYVLSGLTLFHVYHDKIFPNIKEIMIFFKKRIFRIYPLLWLATFISILLSDNIPNLYDLFLNLTGLFGFVKWDTYFAGGAWSIGNELVFYAMFPFFILFSKNYKILMIILSSLIFMCYLYFAFVKLDPLQTLISQKRDYLNPLNHAFLFLGGYLIGLYTEKISVSKPFNYSLIFIGLLVFIFYPVQGNTIHIISGANRLIFTICCFIVCFGFYKMKVNIHSVSHKMLMFLGEISYSVYLLHFITYEVSGRFLKYCHGEFALHYSESFRLIVSFISTIVISYFVYEYYEKLFIKISHPNKTSLNKHIRIKK